MGERLVQYKMSLKRRAIPTQDEPEGRQGEMAEEMADSQKSDEPSI